MPLVVSDTSPIRALAHLGLLDLLQQLFDQVLVPPAVQRELKQPAGRSPVVDVSQLTFVHVQAPQNQARVQQFLQTLDAGESEALALTLEVPGATLLIDEREGREVARQLGLDMTGVVGLLLRAKAHGLVGALRPLLESLVNDLEFFLSAKLQADVLRIAGE